MAFTIPAELFRLSRAVASGATISLTGTILNDWMATGVLMNGQLNTRDPHVMRALMIRIGQLQAASLELRIAYKSEMTDDGSEHVVTLQGDISPLQAPVLAMMFWQGNPDLVRNIRNDVAAEARAPRSPRFYGGINPNWGQRPPVSTLSSDPQTQKADYLAAPPTCLRCRRGSPRRRSRSRTSASRISARTTPVSSRSPKAPGCKP